MNAAIEQTAALIDQAMASVFEKGDGRSNVEGLGKAANHRHRAQAHDCAVCGTRIRVGRVQNPPRRR
jgi:hypothetical protein